MKLNRRRKKKKSPAEICYKEKISYTNLFVKENLTEKLFVVIKKKSLRSSNWHPAHENNNQNNAGNQIKKTTEQMKKCDRKLTKYRPANVCQNKIILVPSFHFPVDVVIRNASSEKRGNAVVVSSTNDAGPGREAYVKINQQPTGPERRRKLLTDDKSMADDDDESKLIDDSISENGPDAHFIY